MSPATAVLKLNLLVRSTSLYQPTKAKPSSVGSAGFVSFSPDFTVCGGGDTPCSPASKATVQLKGIVCALLHPA